MPSNDWYDPEAIAERHRAKERARNGDRPNTMANGHTNGTSEKKRVVVVGLGMVGMAFIEKLLKFDDRRGEYDITVIGEEPHLAYDRVNLTSYFQHRNLEELHLNSENWYEDKPDGSLNYHLNTLVTDIYSKDKYVVTADGQNVSYDILVLSTGSDALVPRQTPGHDATGVFVYRTIEDLQKLIDFAATKRGEVAACVGGGLLGLEAAKALMDLEEYSKIKLIERNPWVLSRQLDGDAGSMVVEQVRELGLDVLLSKNVERINVDEDNNVTGITFDDGEKMGCSCVCFAIGIKARDDLARKSGLNCAEKSGGIIVDDYLATSHPNIYAIGECANWENSTFGLIAPGVEMADVLAFNLSQAKSHQRRKFKRPDMSTKLKLLGVNVASFGDYFADRDGPKSLPSGYGHGKRKGKKENGTMDSKNTVNTTADPEPPTVKTLTYKDPFERVYKKYLFTMDGKYILGGMMIGDTRDYVKLVPMVQKQQKLEQPPSEFIVGAQGDDDGSDLPDDTQICSCHNVLKSDIAQQVQDGNAKSVGDVKSCTKAGSGCGGCVPLVQGIVNKKMEDMGEEVKNNLCAHFDYSRADLFNIVYAKDLDSFEAVMKACGRDSESVGCEACKPPIASILASLYNKHVMDKERRGLQDTNDRFMANIQRNGTYSVIPRVPGGEITPDKLVVIGTVAKKYGLYTKITGGQRIDMFGAKRKDLPSIWRELIDGGMESGHAYAKALRTVKSCVGTTWCRFGVGDSVGMAVRLEERYKSIRSPHKIKGGVSGCVRECAEAQSKDFGLIATEKGYNIFVGGNGGASPRHCDVLAKDVPPDDVVPILDRYLAFYIRTADKLQRTARWIENLPGGIKYLREVILDDKLGICADLERQMADLIDSYFCEWTEALKDEAQLEPFTQFANTSNTLEGVEMVEERGQPRPAYWVHSPATDDFKSLGQRWSSLTWEPIIEASKFAETTTGASRAVQRGDTQLAVFKVHGRYYATQQMCPHRRAFALSEGLVGEDPDAGGAPWISCPLHKRNFALDGGKGAAGACLNDDSVSVATFEAAERNGDGWVYLRLPPVEELDEALGTSKWKVRADETANPFAKLDEKLKAMKGVKGRKPFGAKEVPEGKPANGIDW